MITLHKYESYAGVGREFKLQILADLGRPLTDNDRDTVYEAVRILEHGLQKETDRLLPSTIEEVRETKENLVGLFSQPIFVKDIPNGYGNDWYYANRPWYEVTTSVGIFVIGWRKRVISIDWKMTKVIETASELFPDEDTTRVGQLIHAWGYEKAKEYIDRLMLSAK